MHWRTFFKTVGLVSIVYTFFFITGAEIIIYQSKMNGRGGGGCLNLLLATHCSKFGILFQEFTNNRQLHRQASTKLTISVDVERHLDLVIVRVPGGRRDGVRHAQPLSIGIEGIKDADFSTLSWIHVQDVNLDPGVRAGSDEPVQLGCHVS